MIKEPQKKHNDHDVDIIYFLPELNKSVMYCHECGEVFVTRCDEIHYG